MKFQFIDDVRGSFKLLSVHITAVWAALLGFLASDPMMVVHAWQSIPPELREFLPPWARWIVVVGSVFGSIWLARVTKQPVREKPPETP